MKKRNNSYNIEVVKALSEEFGVSTVYVRQCIRKERHSRTAQTIEKKYRQLAGASLKAIENFKKNPIT